MLVNATLMLSVILLTHSTYFLNISTSRRVFLVFFKHYFRVQTLIMVVVNNTVCSL